MHCIEIVFYTDTAEYIDPDVDIASIRLRKSSHDQGTQCEVTMASSTCVFPNITESTWVCRVLMPLSMSLRKSIANIDVTSDTVPVIRMAVIVNKTICCTKCITLT